MRKKNQILVNSLVIWGIMLFLIIDFTLRGVWGPAQIVIVLLLAALGGLQFWIRVAVLNDEDGNTPVKQKKNKRK